MTNDTLTAGQKIASCLARCSDFDNDIATSLAQDIDAAIAKAVEQATTPLLDALDDAMQLLEHLPGEKYDQAYNKCRRAIARETGRRSHTASQAKEKAHD